MRTAGWMFAAGALACPGRIGAKGQASSRDSLQPSGLALVCTRRQTFHDRRDQDHDTRADHRKPEQISVLRRQGCEVALIDTAGELPSGQKFKGPKELRPILLERLPDFRRCLSEKLLTYALGRGLEYYDKCAVEDICAAVARDGNRMSAMVLAVIKSEPFQYRRGKGAASK